MKYEQHCMRQAMRHYKTRKPALAAMKPHLNEIHYEDMRGRLEDVFHSTYQLVGKKPAAGAMNACFLVLGILVSAIALKMPVLQTRGGDSPSLPVTFRGTSEGAGCREFYNSTTGEIDRVRLLSSADSAYWEVTLPRSREVVVVSLQTCAAPNTNIESVVKSNAGTQKHVDGTIPSDDDFDEFDCSSPDHFYPVHFLLEIPEKWSSAKIRFQVQLSYWQERDTYFREFAAHIYQH